MRFLRRFKNLALVTVTLVGITGCGGGGGGGAFGGRTITAPQSLDGLVFNFFNGFSLSFLRSSGVEGNEQGGVEYLQLRNSVFIGAADGNGNNAVGRDVTFPVALTQGRYRWQVTGPDTGRLTFSAFNNQIYPHPEATLNNDQVVEGDMFWGGPGRLFDTDNLVVDILFGDTEGNITNVTARVRFMYFYTSVFTGGVATTTVDRRQFDTLDMTASTVEGGGVPVGYNPYPFNRDEPTRLVWESIQDRTVLFNPTGRGLVRYIAHQATGGRGPDIPGQRVEESGSILIDVPADNLTGVPGTYSYARVGGNRAVFVISYNRVDGNGASVPVVVTYNLVFTAQDLGRYTENGVNSGNFLQDTFTNTNI